MFDSSYLFVETRTGAPPASPCFSQGGLRDATEKLELLYFHKITELLYFIYP